MNIRSIDRVKAFKMWLHRREMARPCIKHRCSIKSEYEAKIMDNNKVQKKRYLGHVLRGEKLPFITSNTIKWKADTKLEENNNHGPEISTKDWHRE